MRSAFAAVIEEIVAENAGWTAVTYVGKVKEAAPGLVEHFAEHWRDLQLQVGRLADLQSAQDTAKARDLIAERIVIERLLISGSAVVPLLAAALADQYVNLVEEPKILDRLAKSYRNGQQWVERALAELEELEAEARRSTTPPARWRLLLRAALLCQMIINECLNLLAENVAADLGATP